MAKVQQQREVAFENKVKHAEMLKKKSAMLSKEFEAEEKRKAKARQNQIKMLEATKKRLL